MKPSETVDDKPLFSGAACNIDTPCSSRSSLSLRGSPDASVVNASAINLAFLVDGKEEIGVIGCPNVIIGSDTISEVEIDQDGLGVMVFAVRDEGAWMRPMQGNAQLEPATRLERHGDNGSMDKLIWSYCAAFTSSFLSLHREVASKLGTPWPGVDLFSSLMKYASLALGRSHLVIRIFKYASWRSNMWDHAGGILIFEVLWHGFVHVSQKGAHDTCRKQAAR